MAERTQLKIGVVALQGDFAAHIEAVRSAGATDAFEVRTASDVLNADGLILPGGESTTIGKLMARYGLDLALRDANATGKPIFGTCAGMILLAQEVARGAEQGGQPLLGLMDISVARNAFGRQVDSFEADIPVPEIGEQPVRGVFIRAPYIENTGAGVQVMARFSDKIVLVRQDNRLAAAFHPELTGDLRLHQYFLEMVRRHKASD